ncbi:MAG: fluoride efflux transporter CrcB [Desulfohalobiaceae bacterium]
MTNLLWIAMAGAAGTLSRYGLSRAVQNAAGAGFPYGTMVVNIAGCLFFGLVWGFFEQRLPLSDETRFIILTGFLGAFTTFSTFMFETSALIRDSQWLPALLNIAGQTLLGLACVFLGLTLARMM